MTAAFDKFMKQYKMTGSEKADGYSNDAFIGLNDSEKEKAFELLMTELPFSAEWLFLLDKQKAISVVQTMEKKLRGQYLEHVYMLQQQLVKNTGDLTYQTHMIEDFPSYPDRIKPLVVDAIGRTPTSDEAIVFFKQVILTEANSSAVARAARRLLEAVALPRGSDVDDQRYSLLIAELRSDSNDVKIRALAQIERYQI